MRWRLLLICLLALPAFADEKAPDTFTTKDYGRAEHPLGLKRDVKKFRAFKSKAKKYVPSEHRADVQVPAKVDLTPLVSPPEDQGNCGSCWAFGITKAMRSAWMLAGKDPGTLAFNYLVNNCGGVSNQWGCEGGDFDAGQNFLNGKGPWLESQDPYTASGPNTSRCKKLPAAATAKSYVVVGPGNRPPTFQELATVLSQQHMLVIDGAVCGAWGSYGGGIFNRNECGASSINHIINRVGYDCQTSVTSDGKYCVFGSDGNTINHDGFFKDENNWGGWGEAGYIRQKWYVDAWGDTAMYFTVDYTPTPLPVNGGWSEFGPWGDCVNGEQKRARTCNNPAPANGGIECQGSPYEVKACTVPVPPEPPSGDFPWGWLIAGAAVVVLVLVLVLRK